MDSSDLVAVRITSTVIVVVGTVLHSLVIYLTGRRRHADNPAYSLFMQIYCTICILQFMASWTLTLKYGTRSDGQIKATYVLYNGVGSYLGPVFCYMLTLLVNPFINVIYTLVPTGMAFRVYIVYGRKLTRRIVLIAVAIIIVAQIPNSLMLLRAYTSMSTVNIAFTAEERQQLIDKAAVFIIFQTRWEWYYLTFVGSQIFYVCVPVTFLLGLIAFWKLTRYKREISAQTAKVQRAFIYLLTLEALSLCLGFIFDFARNLLRDEVVKSETLRVIVTVYGSCVPSLIPTIQAVAMLGLVPFFREEIGSFFCRTKTFMIQPIHSLS